MTPEQVADAIANPRKGDTWRSNGKDRKIELVHLLAVHWTRTLNMAVYGCCDIQTWRRWCRKATLVKRGEVCPRN